MVDCGFGVHIDKEFGIIQAETELPSETEVVEKVVADALINASEIYVKSIKINGDYQADVTYRVQDVEGWFNLTIDVLHALGKLESKENA